MLIEPKPPQTSYVRHIAVAEALHTQHQQEASRSDHHDGMSGLSGGVQRSLNILARPCHEGPLERFLTVNGVEDANNLYARQEMEHMGLQAGDPSMISTRQDVARRLSMETRRTAAEAANKSSTT